MRQRGTLLLGVGLLSEVFYLVLTVRLPWWRYGGRLRSWSELLSSGDRWGAGSVAGTGAGWVALGACLIGIGVLMAAYIGGWRLVQGGANHGRERRIVWGFAGLFAVTLFWLMPITSDLFTYLSQAHLYTDLGANPLVHAVVDGSGVDPIHNRVQDRLLMAYPTHYATSPSVYGPAWTLVSALGTLGTHDVPGGLVYLKGLAVLAFLACGWSLERILRQLRPESALEGLYLFAWNPLVLLMAVGDGHNDVVMVAAVLLALWSLLRESWALAFGMLALSVWIKFVSVIFLPLFAVYVWRQMGKADGRAVSRGPLRAAVPGGDLWPLIVRGGLAVAAVSVVVLAPFWPIDWVTGLAGRLLLPANWVGKTSGLAAQIMTAGLLLFAMTYVVVARRLSCSLKSAGKHGSRQQASGGAFLQLVDASFAVALLAFVLGAARSQPWHLLWPAALAGVARQWWAWPVVIGLSAVMLAAQVWIEWGTPGIGFAF